MPSKPGPSLSAALQQSVLDALTEGVFTVDRRFRITSMNRAAETMTGVDRREAHGRPCRELFRADCCDGPCALAESLRNGAPVQGRRATILDGNGRTVPVSISTNLLRDRQGRVVGGVETFRDLSQLERLRRELTQGWRFADLRTGNTALRELFATVAIVADSQATVLIQGESGTGKELLARAIHQHSPRRSGPFIALNCGALPDELLESELFGYRRGAFTGAHRDKPGRFALADGGTLFLDEIGEMSSAMQIRLLRVLQEHRFDALGATSSESTDFRLLAATNRDLAADVASGRFREDLFYRLNVVPVTLPPLRQRPEDIPLLAEHFLDGYAARHDRRPSGIAPDALAELMAHDYPGNVRELAHMIERACVLCREGPIRPEHLRPVTTDRHPRPPSVAATTGDQAGRPPATTDPSRSPDASAEPPQPLAEAEAEAIRHALASHAGHRRATAAALGIHPTTLYRKMKRLGLV